MKITNNQLWALTEALYRITENENYNFLPKVSYALAYNLQILFPLYQLLNNQKEKIISKKTSLGITKEDVVTQLEEIGEIEHNNIDLRFISIQDLGDNLLPVGIVNGLMPILENEEKTL